MNNAQKHIKAKEQITKALKALEAAAELVTDPHEYNTSSDIFHASTVKAYNDIVADLIEIIDERGADINEPENTLLDRQILKITPSQATGIVYIILKNE